MTDFLQLPIGERSPEAVNAIIEIPLDGVNKYEYDKKLHVFRLDRSLYSPVHYPGDYGFIPSTKAEDGDPLDILILADTPSFTGCLMEARPIGVLEMTDQGIADQKILAVPTHNPRYSEVHNYSGVYRHVLREMEHFFSIYKDLEGKRTRVSGWGDAERARNLIRESHERFLEEQTQAPKKAYGTKRSRNS